MINMAIMEQSHLGWANYIFWPNSADCFILFVQALFFQQGKTPNNHGKSNQSTFWCPANPQQNLCGVPFVIFSAVAVNVYGTPQRFCVRIKVEIEHTTSAKLSIRCAELFGDLELKLFLKEDIWFWQWHWSVWAAGIGFGKFKFSA